MSDSPRTQLVILSKSPWEPPVRREHALAREALAAGHDVEFIESPFDARQPQEIRWIMPRRPARVERHHGAGTLRIWRRWTPVPGHRSRAASSVDGWLLHVMARRITPVGAVVVCYLPWQWRATRGLVGRRVFDATDDWAALIPRGQARTLRDYSTIAAEADAVVVVAPALRERFPGAAVTVLPNGSDSALLAQPLPERRPERRMVYLGTLSERFDVDLVRGLMELLPHWSLDLYGPCAYAGAGSSPSADLSDLVGDFPDRVKWRGPVSGPRRTEVLDSATVGIIPNRTAQSAGQSSMKLYDYAARGLPVVATPLGGAEEVDAPPSAVFTSDVREFARAVELASDDLAAARQAWAREHSWEARWRSWSRVCFEGGVRS